MLCDKLGEELLFGSRPDERHITDEDVEELGKLIKAVSAEERAEWGDAWVVGGSKEGDIGLGMGVHGAEFEDGEGFLMKSEALLSEEDGAW